MLGFAFSVAESAFAFSVAESVFAFSVTESVLSFGWADGKASIFAVPSFALFEIERTFSPDSAEGALWVVAAMVGFALSVAEFVFVLSVTESVFACSVTESVLSLSRTDRAASVFRWAVFLTRLLTYSTLLPDSGGGVIRVAMAGLVRRGTVSTLNAVAFGSIWGAVHVQPVTVATRAVTRSVRIKIPSPNLRY